MQHRHRHPSLDALAPGDHLCGLFQTDAEYRRLAADYVRLGLKRNEQLFYVADAHPERICAWLTEDGVDVDGCLRRGQLKVVPASQTYFRSGVFEPQAMLDALADMAERAIREGFSALRVTGEMTWALADGKSADRLFEYESLVNRVMAGRKIAALCQYDTRRFPAESLNAAMETHPQVALGSAVVDNAYYVPPEDYLGGSSPANVFSRRVKNLRRLLQEPSGTEDAPASGQPSAGDLITDGQRPIERPKAARVWSYQEMEHHAIVRALAVTGWNKSRAAALLGINRQRLGRRIKKLGLMKKDRGL
jgi:hypothetical protein